MEGRYRKNAGAVFSLKYHLVCCPKYRRPVLVDEIATRLRYLLIEKAAEFGITVHAIEVRPDHVHLFVQADPTLCVAEIVNRLKGYTSRKMRAQFKTLRTRLPCLWFRSFYAGTVGHVREATVRKYIASQKGK
ncbi:MAG TPA: IS200/IS605 family transposase [Gemmataceae bacterium]|jgi:putative transposase